MSNWIETQYLHLLEDILEKGVEKKDRTGTGTLSIFGRQIRHNMKDGFPLLTTKKMAFKTMVTELLWFLRGDTNIKYLVDNNCHIWDGDAHKNYLHKVIRDKDIVRYLKSYSIDTNGVPTIEPYSKEEFIERIKNDDEFAEQWGELGPIYGAQWRNWLNIPGELNKGGTDQIANLISELKTNPDSRRLMVNAYNIGELDQMVLPPCHYGFQVYTRELSIYERAKIYAKKNSTEIKIDTTDDHTALHLYYTTNNIPTRAISLMWNQRSVDTFLGLPFNIASYGLLLELIAKAVGMIPDELIGNLGDVHLYNNHIEQAKEQISRTPYELPKLNINTEFWPTENGSCGEGPLDAVAVFNSFKKDDFCKCLLEEDIQLGNYQSHPAIKAPLSN